MRLDSYTTAFETDGFQAYRAIAVPKDEVLRAREDIEAWKASKQVLVDYQRDRLEHISQMAKLYGSADGVEQQMIVEMEVHVPELNYRQLSAEPI